MKNTIFLIEAYAGSIWKRPTDSGLTRDLSDPWSIGDPAVDRNICHLWTDFPVAGPKLTDGLMWFYSGCIHDYRLAGNKLNNRPAIKQKRRGGTE